MRRFQVIWVGQLISALGSGLTTFALSVWVYQETGSVTRFTIVQVSSLIPPIAVSPLAGAAIDRFGWRVMLIASDLGGCGTVLSLAAIASLGDLRLSHICLAAALLASFNALRMTAYSAAIPALLAGDQLGRANGMVQLTQAVGRIVAPSLGGVLLVVAGIRGVLLIDAVSYGAALAMVSAGVPRLRRTPTDRPRGPLLSDVAHGLHYLRARRGLVGLLAYISAINFIVGCVGVLVTPLVLSVGGPPMLGLVMSSGGFGLLAGGLLMSTWGGPKRRIHGALAFMLIAAAALVAAGLTPSAPLFAAAAFGFFFPFPITNGCSQSIWQMTVDSDVRGRVSAITNLVPMVMLPLGSFAAGPLADHVFEPLMAAQGLLASSVGSLIGVGRGRGIALLVMLNGALTALLVAVSYANPHVRLIEGRLPDAAAGPCIGVKEREGTPPPAPLTRQARSV